MNDFEVTKILTTGVRFKVLEAYAKRLRFLVVLKQCDYSKDEEAEFFIRSALMKVKYNIYSQPLLSIFVDIDRTTSKPCLVFVWRKGSALDPEIEWDRESQFPSGKAGFEEEKVREIYKDLLTTVAIKQAYCPTLGKHVTLRVSTDMDMQDVNSVLKEVLALAHCSHPNICEILDFRLLSTRKGKYRTYIVMELLDQDLAKEIEERKLLAQLYEESELLEILLNVSSALVHLKSVNIAYRYIKPSNILRASQGLKLSGLGSTCLKELHSEAAPYTSPEARTLGSSAVPFECDVFSLGMSMLHLATLELPATTVEMIDEELHTLLQREVTSLQYSSDFKRLIGGMLSVSLNSRPPIEAVRRDAISLYHQVPKSENLVPAAMLTLDSLSIVSQKQKADQLAQQALSDFEAERYAEAGELYAAAQAIYSRLSDDKATANNLRHWGTALRRMKNFTEAVRKHAAADALYSHFPNDNDTALNFFDWGCALNKVKNYAEAERKYAAANAIFSHFSNDKGTADSLCGWGCSLYNMKNYTEAEKKRAQAHIIYSHFFPDDKYTAFNLFTWGDALKKTGKNEEAMSKYTEAEAIYSRIPIDKMTFFSLIDWTEVLEEMGNKEKAVRVLAAAATRYSLHSNKKFIAQILNKWGCLLNKMYNYGEALGKFEETDAIYSVLCPCSEDTAVNLNVWGHALLGLYRYEEAARKFAETNSILFRLCPDGLDSALNFSNWAYSLCKMEDYEEALRKFAAANTLFSHLPIDAFSAGNFYFWGDTLSRIGRKMEAIAKYEAARQVYLLLEMDIKDCDWAIAKQLELIYSAMSIGIILSDKY